MLRVWLLLEKGADKDRATDRGATPLLIACVAGNLEIAMELVIAGATLGALSVHDLPNEAAKTIYLNAVRASRTRIR